LNGYYLKCAQQSLAIKMTSAGEKDLNPFLPTRRLPEFRKVLLIGG
jgi:hypothetical protein